MKIHLSRAAWPQTASANPVGGIRGTAVQVEFALHCPIAFEARKAKTQ